eukprot:COSAG01_NODE_872_length_12988_cov_4.918846_9_plen_92_part_00
MAESQLRRWQVPAGSSATGATVHWLVGWQLRGFDPTHVAIANKKTTPYDHHTSRGIALQHHTYLVSKTTPRGCVVTETTLRGERFVTLHPS